MTNNPNADPRPLCQFPSGSKVLVDELMSCRSARSRLLAMGVTPGVVVEIVSNDCGPCRLKVRGSDVCIGHGMAERIQARLAPADAAPTLRASLSGCACPGER